MNCNEAKELIVEYRDLPTTDIRRQRLIEHIRHCAACEEQFRQWEESVNLIQNAADPQPNVEVASASISNAVMNRIYQDESWRMPVAERMYTISYALRRKLLAVISFCLALFIVAFIHSIAYEPAPVPVSSIEGLIPVASAIGDSEREFGPRATLLGLPVASISEPFILGMQPIKTTPDYMVVLSLLGIVAALLTMNWFSRIKV